MPPINRMRYAKKSVEGLNQNERYMFARRYSLHLNPSNNVYN
jgi:hypothetical protein